MDCCYAYLVSVCFKQSHSLSASVYCTIYTFQTLFLICSYMHDELLSNQFTVYTINLTNIWGLCIFAVKSSMEAPMTTTRPSPARLVLGLATRSSLTPELPLLLHCLLVLLKLDSSTAIWPPTKALFLISSISHKTSQDVSNSFITGAELHTWHTARGWDKVSHATRKSADSVPIYVIMYIYGERILALRVLPPVSSFTRRRTNGVISFPETPLSLIIYGRSRAQIKVNMHANLHSNILTWPLPGPT